MRLTFWGTRGSLPKPGPKTLRYGGNTSCVQLVSDSGTLMILDCGTGAHALGQQLLEAPPARGHILVSHTHWDHIQGLPFFKPLFVPGNELDIYGPTGFGESLKEALAGQMQYAYFPVSLDALAAQVRFHDLVEGSFEVGDVLVRTRYLNHTALTLGYRLEVDGVSVVYACDHEPHSKKLATGQGEIGGQDRAHAEFLRDADLVIHDAQYTVSEYPSKAGWGHSTAEYAVRLCRAVGVKRLALTHHDPMREDEDIDRLMSALKTGTEDDRTLEIFPAAEGHSIELTVERAARAKPTSPEASALRVAGTPAGHTLLLGLTKPPEIQTIAEAARADDVDVVECSGVDEILQRCVQVLPSLVMLDGDPAGLDVCQAIRALDDQHARDVPIIMVASEARVAECVTDWLVSPFTVEYARTRMRAWLIRTECRWVRAPLPEDEAARLSALRELGILDTATEERFDRITRLLAAVLDVPVSLLSLVDQDRQWFKSRVGLSVGETSREASFCAHAILESEPLVVSDTLNEDRFADNPLVRDHPHLRFYAGCPVSLPDGHRIGTLCAIDTRPRELTDDQLQLLRDLTAVVEGELSRSG
jgi:phosphoribosyl 1,2-cyclic phosphodiesterase/CheY-like chemotaxis protein